MILVAHKANGETVRFDLTMLNDMAADFELEIASPKMEVTGATDREREFVHNGLGDRVTLHVVLWAERFTVEK